MSTPTAGSLLRTWRESRRVSQLALAHGAGVSPRHLSFIETGRSHPTSQMILRLCRHLDVPLREQNRLLLAGGFAPAHPEHGLADRPMVQIAEAIELILAAHLPFPALVVDRGWDLVSANDAVYALFDGVAADLLEPPVNVIRLALDAGGLAPRIANLAEWRDHLVERLAREYAVSADPRLRALVDEYGPMRPEQSERTPGLVVPLRLRTSDGELSLISTTTVFGTPREVTVSELAIETFLPADAATRAAFLAEYPGQPVGCGRRSRAGSRAAPGASPDAAR